MKWIDPDPYEVDRGVKSMWIESGSSADRPLDLQVRHLESVSHVGHN